MNIELKPIAESKVRQLGGDVCGVLVRTEDGVMAVSEHGRCTRLDAGVMGPVEPAGMNERELFEQRFPVPAGIYWNDISEQYDALPGAAGFDDVEIYHGQWMGWQAARAQGGQGAGVVKPGDPLPCPFCGSTDVGGAGGTVGCYRCPAEIAVQNANTAYAVELWNNRVKTHPQPAVPEGWRKAARGAIEFAKDGLCETHPLTAAEHIKGMASLILSAAPTTPQADGWIRCKDRLPTEDDGYVWIYYPDVGVSNTIWQWDDDIGAHGETHWAPTGLKRPQPPKQEGSDDE